MMTDSLIGEPILVIPSQNSLGENALWHPNEQAIYWIDIMLGQLHRFDVASAKHKIHPLPYRIGSFAFLANVTPESEFQIIAAFEQGIALYHLDTQAIEWLSQPEASIKGNRFNDGKTDRCGDFWAGTMVEAPPSDAVNQFGNLYRVSRHKQLHKMAENILISNGLCWNEAGDIMYHADSERHVIYRYHYDQQQKTISHKTEFATTEQDIYPDGSTVDTQGFMWNAQWGDYSVVRYSPDGEIVNKLMLPAKQPSSVAIGGPNLDWLIVTTSRVALSESDLLAYPLSGNVFVYQLDNITGLVETPCNILINNLNQQ